MDKRNKNIEDFFNKSLEQFSDAPSDRVWAGIAQQLEVDKPPFYKRWKFWMSSFMAIAALLLLSYGYYTTQKAIDLLMVKTNQLEQENQELKLALNDCSVVSEKLITEKESQNSIGKSNFIRQDVFTENRAHQQVGAGNSFKNTFFVPSFFSSVNYVGFANENLITEKTVDLLSDVRFRQRLNLSSPTDDFSQRMIFPTDGIAINEMATDFSDGGIKDNIEISLSKEAIATIKASGFHRLTKLENKRIRSRRVKTTFRRKLPNSFMDYVPFNLTQPIANKLDYKFGFSFGWMNTFTDKKDLFGPGYNIGFTNELQLFKEVYLTGSLNFVQQNYEVKLNATNQAILQTYPGVTELTSVVTSINQHVHILELPIGLKWYFKENAKGTKFYANPAVAWHFYFPQQFGYEIATNAGIITEKFTNDQYFGYFGTMQMQVGMERPLFKKFNYQVGLWAEKSLIPLGVENRKLFNVGIRGAILLK